MQNHPRPWLVSLKHYAYMCLLLSGPERLPVFPQAIGYNILAYVLVSLMASSDDYSYLQTFGATLFQFSLMGLVAYVGLNWKNLLPRFVQTYSAMTGVILLIDSITILLFHAIVEDAEAQASAAMTIYLINLFWNLTALSLIFKRAFEVTHFAAAMISFNFYAFYLIIANWLFQ